MKNSIFAILFAASVGTASAAATAIEIPQRDALDRNAFITIIGSSNPWEAVGFNASGILTALTLWDMTPSTGRTAGRILAVNSGATGVEWIEAPIGGDGAELSDGDKGDITVASGGAVWTIDANSVALGTDTTGNYVATIADSGAGEITVTGSGAENAAVTLAIAASIARDSEVTALLSGYIENNANIEDLSDNSLASQITFESGTVLQGPSVAALPALSGNAMDLTEYGGIHSATSNATLTFSGSPVTGQVFLLAITADGTQRTTTIPSAYSVNTGSNITSVVTPANATQYLTFRRESARWVVFGDPTPTTGSGNYVLATSPTVATPTITGAITFPDNVEQVFNPGATNAGLNVGSIAGDPSAPNNGALWYDSTANELTARINGSNVALGAGGGGSSLTATYVGYGNGSNNLTGEAAFTYNATTDTLTVGAMNVTDLNTTNLNADSFLLAETDGAGPQTVEIYTPTTVTANRRLGIAVPDANTVLTISGTGTAALVGDNIGAATATTPSAGDNDTSVATTAFVQVETEPTESGTHASPNTTTPLSPTWTGPLHTVWNNATSGVVNLPAASTYSGKGFIVYNLAATAVRVNPDDAHSIVRDGTLQTAGKYLELNSGSGNYVSLLRSGDRWVTLGYKGTLTGEP